MYSQTVNVLVLYFNLLKYNAIKCVSVLVHVKLRNWGTEIISSIDNLPSIYSIYIIGIEYPNYCIIQFIKASVETENFRSY